MAYLIIQAKPNYYLPMMDSIGKRGINYSWNTENRIILIEGDENISKVKAIWNIIKNGIEHYEEGRDES